MERKGSMVWASVFVGIVMVFVFCSASHVLAFWAPNENSGMDAAQESEAANPGLRSIMLRNLNITFEGEGVQFAKDLVENIINTGSVDGEHTLGGGEMLNPANWVADAKLKTVQTDNLGFEHIRFTQRYRGLPVVAGEFNVHINREGIVYQIDGYYLPAMQVSVEPTIDPAAALQIGLDEQAEKPGLSVSVEPSLVMYGLCLAFHYVISHEGPDPGQWWYYVDADTGKVIQRYNNIHI